MARYITARAAGVNRPPATIFAGGVKRFRLPRDRGHPPANNAGPIAPDAILILPRRTRMDTTHTNQTGFDPLAGVAAVIFPGAGHLVRREPRRAALVAIGVLGLFFGGILVGGIDVIDSREDRVWFFGQALVGPLAFGIDYAHQHHFKVIDLQKRQPRTALPDEARNPVDASPLPIRPDPAGVPTATYTRDGKAVTMAPARPPNIKSLSKVNELGTLMATLAGMLNLIIVIDALFPTLRRENA